MMIVLGLELGIAISRQNRVHTGKNLPDDVIPLLRFEALAKLQGYGVWVYAQPRGATKVGVLHLVAHGRLLEGRDEILVHAPSAGEKPGAI
ncbi:hypothetical protein [Nonomuraea turcica]|uniref:hypothetical protein n=1 Tax=Nonomuraea sp. G32 TaxID=3067274 RepID=UPI00273C8C2D|nr:hypothetical protein [Nonomuraea sp. G32]MDP4508887.1 hypothetical protein [Nonomuraea sp. G32]